MVVSSSLVTVVRGAYVRRGRVRWRRGRSRSLPGAPRSGGAGRSRAEPARVRGVERQRRRVRCRAAPRDPGCVRGPRAGRARPSADRQRRLQRCLVRGRGTVRPPRVQGIPARFCARFEQGAAFDGSRFVHSPRFDQTHFGGFAMFRIPERGPLDKTATVFERRGHFVDAVFAGGANFLDDVLRDARRIRRRPIGPCSTFERAVFRETATFSGIGMTAEQTAREAPALSFGNARFEAVVDMTRADLRGNVSFYDARFEGPALFAGVRFGVFGVVRVGDVRSTSRLQPRRVRRGRLRSSAPPSEATSRSLRPASATGTVRFDESVATGPPRPAFALTRSIG